MFLIFLSQAVGKKQCKLQGFCNVAWVLVMFRCFCARGAKNRGKNKVFWAPAGWKPKSTKSGAGCRSSLLRMGVVSAQFPKKTLWFMCFVSFGLDATLQKFLRRWVAKICSVCVLIVDVYIINGACSHRQGQQFCKDHLLCTCFVKRWFKCWWTRQLQKYRSHAPAALLGVVPFLSRLWHAYPWNSACCMLLCKCSGNINF